MKYRNGFYGDSLNCQFLGGSSKAFKCILQRDLQLLDIDPWSLGEWHHASANRIAFFPQTEKQKEKILKVIEEIKEYKNQIKGKDLPKSKAEVWRKLSNIDCGFGSVEYKNGKFGKFVCSFGNPDGVLYFPSEEFAEVAKKLLY